MKLHRLRAFLPFPRACASDSLTVVFSASKIFGRKTAKLSETVRKSVYSGSAF